MAIELRARGYEPLHIRQPIPSTGQPGIIAFCQSIALDPLSNVPPVFGRLLATDAEILSIKKGLMNIVDKVDGAIHDALAELDDKGIAKPE